MRFATSHPAGSEITFFLRDLDGGGAERAIVSLTGEIAKRGYTVDLVVGDAKGDYRAEVSTAVHVEDFATRSPLLVLTRLIRYLRQRNPAVVMSALDVANIILIAATRLALYKGKTVIGQRATVTATQIEQSSGRGLLMRFLQRLSFPQANALISNSHAAGSELRELLGVPADKIVTIHNSVDAERINQLANEPLYDNWLLQSQAPLILSVGNVTQIKDRATLVKAFALAKAQRNVRLVILGRCYQPVERKRVERLISDLGLTDHVYLPGFDSNPYRWMRRASVVVSSSITEGCPNQLLEALALGIPIVATDCPGDTAVLLGHGSWGRLVPVGDAASMAAAILASLDDPAPSEGRVRAADFAPARTADAYLKVLLPSFNLQTPEIEEHS